MGGKKKIVLSVAAALVFLVFMVAAGFWGVRYGSAGSTAEIEREVSELRTVIESQTAEADRLAADLDQLRREGDQLVQGLADITGRIADYSNRVGRLAGEGTAMAGQIGTAVNESRILVEGIETDVGTARQIREEISGIIGGGTGEEPPP